MNDLISNIDSLKSVIQSPSNSSQDLYKGVQDNRVVSLEDPSLCSSSPSLSDSSSDFDFVEDTASLIFGATENNDIDDDDDIVQRPNMLSLDTESDKFHAYAESREMTPIQEKINALTVVPNPIYCIFYLLSGKWLSEEAISLAHDEMISTPSDQDWLDAADQFTLLSFLGIDTTRCITNPLLPSLYSLPPFPVMAVALGITLHAPFSFIYHWYYTHRLPPGSARMNHWSRRMDQSFIHVCSACMAYGTSGRWNFFWVNALYNLDCIYRQFKRRVYPRRNKIRLYISIIAYTLPIVRRGETILFLKLWTLFVLSGWLFAKYPIKGWSHSAFHIVVAFVPPLLMKAASGLAASEAHINVAARCAVLAGRG